jgi:hypothetical protein
LSNANGPACWVMDTKAEYNVGPLIKGEKVRGVVLMFS